MNMEECSVTLFCNVWLHSNSGSYLLSFSALTINPRGLSENTVTKSQSGGAEGSDCFPSWLNCAGVALCTAVDCVPNVKHEAEKSNGALKTHGRSQSGPGPESLTSLVHNENPLQSLASGGIFMCSGDITPFSFESTRQWCVTHRSCPFWLSSLTHLLHHRLPLMSTNSHQHQGALRRGDAHTHTHNSQFLFHCLCNGWVEWAGPGLTARPPACLHFFGEWLLRLHPFPEARPPPQRIR